MLGNRNMRKVTLADIAKMTGYSVNTVSHALKDKKDISVETKKLIVSTANKMGYIPNASSYALRWGKSMSVAIIVSDITNPYFAIMIKEMESQLSLNGYSTLVINTFEDEEKERKAIISAIEKNVDGILICPVQKNSDNIDFLEKRKMPYVLFGRKFEDMACSYVMCDDVEGGFLAAEHLIKLEHRNILFLNTSDWISSSRERMEGILKAFEAYSVPEDCLQVETLNVQGDTERINEVLEKHSDCTAIICFSDLIAYQVCYCLKHYGLRVPEDVSVIGFDNIASKYYFPLLITSISSAKTEISIQCVRILKNIIEGKIASEQMTLPVRLVERESTKRNKKTNAY